jgi:AraC family transcriptional regulator
MTEAPSDRQRREYTARINRVLDYIDRHIDQELTLDELANVANFSRFHFHRIFKAMVGETLSRFIQRLRIERAAAQLTGNPQKTITEIALDCGFSGSAAFSRAFRDFFGMSPSEWRAAGSDIDSNLSKTIGNPGKEPVTVSFYIDLHTNQPTWRFTMKQDRNVTVEVKDLPAQEVAYVRHIGPYAGDSALFENLFTKLMTWASARNLVKFPETQILAVYHDDPNVTEEEKLRVSACMTVPSDTKSEGEIGRMTIPGGSFAVARFEINPDEYEDAWNSVMKDWLPGSGYQPDDRLCFEWYQNDPHEHPEGKHIFDICLPVKPL